MKEQPHICPLCGRAYDEPPALSRADNQTDICPRCGMMEALAAMPRRETPQDRTRRAVYATGNRWAIENFEATHHYRHITTNNIEATSPEALKGLSIRTQENPIHMASFQAWGASPTPMAFSELFTALQQGAVDAEENPLAVITANRLYEVQNTVTLTGHFYTAGIFNINKDFYESLEGQDKEWFDEASEHFVQNLTQLIRDAQEGYIQLLKDNGINVVEVTSEQKDAFIESAASVYDLFIEKYGGTQELIDLAMKYNDDF